MNVPIHIAVAFIAKRATAVFEAEAFIAETAAAAVVAASIAAV